MSDKNIKIIGYPNLSAIGIFFKFPDFLKIPWFSQNSLIFPCKDFCITFMFSLSCDNPVELSLIS